MIRTIGAIVILANTSVFGQETLADQIKTKIRPDFELIALNITDDTLTLVSTHKFLYYPFGTFSDLKSLKRNYPDLYKQKNGVSYLVDTNSYVKFFYDDDQKAFEVVYATISSPNMKLTNGTHVGITKKELLKKYFSVLPDNIDKISVLMLESGVTGIWHYYKFDGEVLVSFILDTNYQLDKN